MLRPLRTILTLVTLLVAFATLSPPRSADTLPLFARDRKLPCSTCHFAFPRLNQMGMHFKQNGYRMPGEMGTSPWEKEHFPISLVGNVGANWQRTDVDTSGGLGLRATTTNSAFQQNWVEFHTCGTLAEKVTFHFDNGFANDTGFLHTGMAFVQFDDVAKDGALNVKVGIFDGEIPYISDARRTTMAGYLTSWTQDNRGVELNGTQSSWLYAAGVVNSERTMGKAGSTNLNNLENVYAWLSREIGTNLISGRVRMERQDPRVANKDASTHTQADVSAYICPSSEKFAVIPGFTMEHFSDQDTQKNINTAMLEAIAKFDKDSRWVGTGRFEQQMIPAAGGAVALNSTQVALNLAYYVNQNARIALDWTHQSQDQGGPKIDQVQAFVHVAY